MTSKALCALDYDGVILDSMDRNLAAMRAACLRMGHNRLPGPRDLEALDNMVFAELARIIGVPENNHPALSELVFEELTVSTVPARIFPGMAEALTRLSERFALAIVTANEADIVEEYLKESGLRHRFTHILGGESGEDKSQKLVRLMAKMGTDPQRTVMVGDAVSDIRMGRRAGVRTVAVSWGFQSVARLTEARPDAVVERPPDLPPLLAEWF